MKIINRIIIIILIFCYSILKINAQHYRILPSNYHKDSSIYAVTQINPTTYWMGGENGYLKEVNENGEITDLNYSFEGKDIYKIVADEKSVYMVGAGPSLWIIDKETHTLKTYLFNSNLNKRCFYDILLLPNNQMMLCGGNNAIAHAGKKIPIGFIATCDRSNPAESMKIVLKRKLKFTFTLEANPSTNEIYAATFNGIHTSIFCSKDNGINWSKKYRVKGIIHDLQFDHEGKIWFAGTPGLNYRKNGMFGYIEKDVVHKIITSDGCLWKLCEIDESLYAASVSGSLLKISKNNLNYTSEKTSMKGALYTMANFSNKSLIICGHGKSVCIRY